MSVAQGGVSGLLAGRYAIERELGQGATATVHLARDTRAGMSVAVKLLRPELAESNAAKRFLKEIRRTASLDHPRILKVLDAGEHDGRPFFVLPYMEGGTLRQRLKREPQLPLDEAIAIARSVAEALDYAHERGLVHQDVKPENILFTGGVACLGDFGIAHALEAVYGEASSTTHVIRGTPAYMSPEQAAGETNLDGRSDQYSLACVFYEMVTGMPAFMGPTPESVIAQRFAHGPREVRVYRPGISAGVQVVLDRALAIQPAERYPSCTLAADELERSTRFSEERREPVVHRWWRPRIALVGGLALAVSIGAYVASGAGAAYGPLGDGARAADMLDTTSIVVLPFEYHGPVSPWRGEDLLMEGLSRWTGINIVDQFQVADAVQRVGPIRTSQDARRAVASLHAGRFIRGEVTSSGAETRVTLSLFNVADGRSLYQVRHAIPSGLPQATAMYASLADSVLLRGTDPESAPPNAAVVRSLPAVTAFGRGLLALDEWDLAAAEHHLQAATTADPDFARAHLWLAQVRAWQSQPSTAWLKVAERAEALSGALTEREGRMSRALVWLGRGSYEAACAVYDTLRQRNERDFTAWFGSGQCRSQNRHVVRDTTALSGWRFQSSAHQAMQAYARAFDILPSVHRGYERGAFERLRVLLLVETQAVTGFRLGDSARFLGRPAWIGDSLVLVPYPWEEAASGGTATIPPGFEEALRRRRAEFMRVAAGWSSAFPNSGEAKHAVAIALELHGDVAALDTIRVAHALARPGRRADIAAREVLLLLKFGLHDRARMVEARRLSDSLLAALAHHDMGAVDAALPVAMLRGDCRRATGLAWRSRLPAGNFGVQPALYARSQAALVLAALDCPGNADSVQVLAREIAAVSDGNPGRDDRARLDATLLFRPALFATGVDRETLRHLGASVPHPFVVAAARVEAGDDEGARAVLEASQREDAVDFPSPDLAFIRARLHVASGDTAAAIRLLDGSLERVRYYSHETLSEVGKLGGLLRSIALRHDLALAAADRATADRWSLPLRALRGSAEQNR